MSDTIQAYKSYILTKIFPVIISIQMGGSIMSIFSILIDLITDGLFLALSFINKEQYNMTSSAEILQFFTGMRDNANVPVNFVHKIPNLSFTKYTSPFLKVNSTLCYDSEFFARASYKPKLIWTFGKFKLEADILRNAAFASPAVALASNVLPVPGGPTSKKPLGSLAPIF